MLLLSSIVLGVLSVAGMGYVRSVFLSSSVGGISESVRIADLVGIRVPGRLGLRALVRVVLLAMRFMRLVGRGILRVRVVRAMSGEIHEQVAIILLVIFLAVVGVVSMV